MAPLSHHFLLRNTLGMSQMEPLMSYTGDLKNGLNVAQCSSIFASQMYVSHCILMRNRVSMSEMEL